MVIVVARVYGRCVHRGTGRRLRRGWLSILCSGLVGLVGCRVTVNGLGEVVKGSNLLR